MKFKNKTIVVTGGGSGIGMQIAEDLFKEGANICILGRNQKKLEQTRETILQEVKGTGSFLVHACDVASPGQTAEIFDAIQKEGLQITGLVNNAGINPSRNAILNTTFEDWQKTIDVNLTGAFNCTKEAVRRMVENGGGSIVNVASIAGITALPERAAYMPSKWGLVGLTQSVALDYASKNIRVNCVCPGYVETPLVDKFLSGLSPEKKREFIHAHALRRLGTTSDISKAVLFLLLDNSSWITGVTLPVDGGYCIGKKC